MSQVLDLIKNEPFSRRILWDGWNVGELDKMTLPPCHKEYQFFVRDKFLDMKLSQRSVDVGLGLPFNICAAAMLLTIVAQQTDLDPGVLTWVGGDTHIYKNHERPLSIILARKPRQPPKLILKNKPSSLFEYSIDDFEIHGYHPYPQIRLEVAI